MGSSIQRLRNSSGQFVSAGVAVEKSAGGIEGSMGSAASGLLSNVFSMKGGLASLAIGAGVAAAAVGAAFGMMTLKGVQAAASYEQTTIAFESSFKSMGRSAQDAQTYLKNLRDFAAKTPFTLTGLLDSVRGLIAVGNSPEKVIQSMLPAIGDMASMMGVGEDAIAGVVFAMRQMTGAPRVLAQDLYQVQNALPGFNAKAALAKDKILALAGGFKQGDMAGLTKAMEGGLISGKQAVDALIRGMEKFPGAAGMMQKQSETMNGVMSTFKDNINNALIDGFGPAIPAISKALLKLMPVVQNLTKGFADAMGPQLSAAIGQVVPALTQMSQQAGPLLGAFIGKILPLMTPLIETLARVGFVIGGVLMAALEALGPVFTSVTSAVNQILSALSPVIGALVNVGKALGGSSGAFQLMLQQITLMIQIAAPWVAVLLQGVAILIQLANRVTGVLLPIQRLTANISVMKYVVANNLSILIPVVQKIAYAFGFASSFIKQAIIGIGKAMAPMIASVRGGLNSMLGWFGKAGEWIARAWRQYGARFAGETKNFLGSAIRIIAGFAGQMFRAAWNLANKLTGGLLSGLDVSMPGFLKDLIGWTDNAMANAAQAGAASANEAGRKVGDAFRQGVINGMGTLPGGVAAMGGYGPGGTQGPKGHPTPPPMPDTGLSMGGGAGGGGGGGGGGSSQAVAKAIKDLAGLISAIKSMGNHFTKLGDIIKRSKEFLASLGIDTKAEIAKFTANIKDALKNGINTKQAKEFINALRELSNGVSNALSNAKKTFARFKDLTLRAFDAETTAQIQGIHDQYSGVSGPMMQNFQSSATVPDFGSLDLGNTDYLNNLDQSITDMRTGLTSALQGLFGNGGSFDMSIQGITGRFNAAMKSIEAARTTAINAAETARNQEYKAAEVQRSALTPAEQAIKDLQEGASQENLMRNKQQAEEALAAAQKIRNVGQRNAAIQAAQSQLNDALRAIQLDQLQKQAEIERTAADTAYNDRVSAADTKYNDAVTEADRLYQLAVTTAQAEYDREAAANKAAEDEAVKNAEFLRETQRLLLQDHLDRLESFIGTSKDKHKKFNKELADIIGDPVFAQAFKNSGANLGKMFAKGLENSQDDVTRAMKHLANIVADFLRLHSPAKKGPLASLDTWWKAMSDTLLVGIDEKKIKKSIDDLIDPNIGIGFSLMNPKAGDIGLGKPSTSKGDVTINVTVGGSVIQERDLAESIRQELIKIGRRDGTIFGGIV